MWFEPSDHGGLRPPRATGRAPRATTGTLKAILGIVRLAHRGQPRIRSCRKPWAGTAIAWRSGAKGLGTPGACRRGDAWIGAGEACRLPFALSPATGP